MGITASSGLSRKDFLQGALASMGQGFLGGRGVFALPEGWRPPGPAKLVFGVVSDTHMRTHYDGFVALRNICEEVKPSVNVGKVGPDLALPLDGYVPGRHPAQFASLAKIVGNPKRSLPPGKELTFRVLPSSEFGERGKPIEKAEKCLRVSLKSFKPNIERDTKFVITKGANISAADSKRLVVTDEPPWVKWVAVENGEIVVCARPMRRGEK